MQVERRVGESFSVDFKELDHLGSKSPGSRVTDDTSVQSVGERGQENVGDEKVFPLYLPSEFFLGTPYNYKVE